MKEDYINSGGVHMFPIRGQLKIARSARTRCLRYANEASNEKGKEYWLKEAASHEKRITELEKELAS